MMAVAERQPPFCKADRAKDHMAAANRFDGPIDRRRPRRSAGRRGAARRPGHSTWAVLAFLAGFTVLLVFLCYGYLFPALRAAADATPQERKALSAHAALLLAIVLVILLSGLVLTFRVGRFFFPRDANPKRRRTVYSDAWAEAGRRFEAPPRPDEER